MAKPCTPRPITRKGYATSVRQQSCQRLCNAQRVQLFELQTANGRGQGAGPLAFSWGYKGDILSRERISPLLWAAPSALPSPRTFVQKIKKRRLFQPSLLYLHYCKTFLLP